MAKRHMPVEQRKVAPLIVMLPLGVRAEVERMAVRGRISLSELGRRAITEFLARRATP